MSDTELIHQTSRLEAALNITRRLPPSSLSNTLQHLITLAPDLSDELLQRVDLPLKTATDNKTGKKFVLCEYNRISDESHRPPQFAQAHGQNAAEGKAAIAKPSTEAQLNDLFTTYTNLYFPTSSSTNPPVSSVYLFDADETDTDNICGVAAICQRIPSATWDSVHVFTLSDSASNNLVSVSSNISVGFNFNTSTELTGNVSSITTTENAGAAGVVAIGETVEKGEVALRHRLQELYVTKTKEIVSRTRWRWNDSVNKQQQRFVPELIASKN